MKRILTLLLALSITLQANFFKEEDKQSHMIATTMVGIIGHLMAKKHGATEFEAFWTGVGSALVIGLAKEAYDSRDGGTGFDSRDMIANGIGGVLGSGTMYTIFKW